MNARAVTTILLAGWALFHALIALVAFVLIYEEFRPGDYPTMPAPALSRVTTPTPVPTPRVGPTAGELRALGLKCASSGDHARRQSVDQREG